MLFDRKLCVNVKKYLSEGVIVPTALLYGAEAWGIRNAESECS